MRHVDVRGTSAVASHVNIAELRNKLRWLQTEDGVAPAKEVGEAIGDILLPLLEAEGLELLSHKDPDFIDIDYAARRADSPTGELSVAIEYKHHGHGTAAGTDVVQSVLGAIFSGPFDRALVISRFGFTASALQFAAQAPITVELLDLASISDWISRVETGLSNSAKTFELLVRTISHEFAVLIARDPKALDHLEWRDLERTMCRVMEGLGFQTTLTPPSKDGGKDLILKCQVKGKTESYIVELKHWRAGKPVIKGAISDFIKVIVREHRQGGLFLSTSGYASNAAEALTELSRQKFRLGSKEKVVMLAQTYVRANSGLWNPPTELPEILFDGPLSSDADV